MARANILVYVLRRDLRVSDNPILHEIASSKHAFTHLLPVYVFPAQQMEVSGFLKDGGNNPYPAARSPVGGYWRCGPHRSQFIGQAVWDVKTSLESLGSGLVIRVGMLGDALNGLLEGFKHADQTVGAVWMIGEEGVEEKRDEQTISSSCEKHSVPFKLWVDEKYFIDDRDLNFSEPKDLPDVFTTYRKSVEPLRQKPRATLPRPTKSSLPPLPDSAAVPPQHGDFSIPHSYEELERCLLKPVAAFMDDIPEFPEDAVSPHPFSGGEVDAQARLDHLVKSGAMADYKTTRNGLIGADFSTKLSAYLAQGCLTARQVHQVLTNYEDGTTEEHKEAKGYGEGENEGTQAVRLELLWRDYMRLCTKKFKHKLFRPDGFRDGEDDKDKKPQWKVASIGDAQSDQTPSPQEIAKTITRFNAGTTGMGLIDASQRELLHTGYTSNRARQNVASFLAKHLGIDWRYGAEWYEMLLLDYDVNSNWANWQYVAGVGNDPRGEARIFNPVKQAFDYDKEGKYVRMWVPEVRGLEKLENVFQAWTASAADLEAAGLTGNPMVTDPVKRIEFSVEGKPRSSRRPFVRRNRGNGNGRPPNGKNDGVTSPTSDSNDQATSSGKPSPAGPASPSDMRQKDNFSGPIQNAPPGPARRGRGGNGGGYRGGNWGYYNGRGGVYRGRYPPGPGGVGPVMHATWTMPMYPTPYPMEPVTPTGSNGSAGPYR